MNSIQGWFKWFFTLLGGLVVGFLGGWDVALQVLVIFVIFDYITGVTAAFYEKKLDSEVGMWGIFRKLMLFIPIGVGYWVDTVAGVQVFRSMAIFFYIANEGLSIIENLGRVGIPIPEPLKAALEQLKKKAEDENDGKTISRP